MASPERHLPELPPEFPEMGDGRVASAEEIAWLRPAARFMRMYGRGQSTVHFKTYDDMERLRSVEESESALLEGLRGQEIGEVWRGAQQGWPRWVPDISHTFNTALGQPHGFSLESLEHTIREARLMTNAVETDVLNRPSIRRWLMEDQAKPEPSRLWRVVWHFWLRLLIWAAVAAVVTLTLHRLFGG